MPDLTVMTWNIQNLFPVGQDDIEPQAERDHRVLTPSCKLQLYLANVSRHVRIDTQSGEAGLTVMLARAAAAGRWVRDLALHKPSNLDRGDGLRRQPDQPVEHETTALDRRGRPVPTPLLGR